MSEGKGRIGGLKIQPPPSQLVGPAELVDAGVTAPPLERPKAVEETSLDDLLDIDEYEADMAVGLYSCQALPSIFDED